MKSGGSFFLALLPFLVLAGCAAPPHSESPARLRRPSAAVDDVKEVLTDADAYALSEHAGCRAMLTIKWPAWRRQQEGYSEATTVLEFDWGRIASSSYQAASAMSIGFSFPQRYETHASSPDGSRYDAIGFFDGLDLDVKRDPASAAKAVNAILSMKEACSQHRRDMATQNEDSYSPEEQYQLGNAYLFSRHPGPKPVPAYQWFEQAARRGNMKAQLMMGNALRSGLHGRSRDLVAARHWFELAASQGSPHAQGMLGNMYEHGAGGLPRDLAKAAAFYRRAAEQGLALEQEALADMLRFGRGIPKDSAEARVWYRKAEAAGSSSARDALIAMEKE